MDVEKGSYNAFIEGENGDVYGKEKDRRREVNENIDEIIEEYLNSKFDVATTEFRNLPSHFFISKKTAIDPSLALAHQSMKGLNRINMRNGIRNIH